jgi:uncharacterized protein (TIGR00266 family)
MSSGEGGFLGGGGILGPYSSVPSVAAGANRSAPGEALRFEVKGHEMQFVEIALDPGRACIAEAGAMMFKDGAVGMETIFGDGADVDSGLLGKLWRGAKRALSGSTLFMTRFANNGYGPAHVAFAAPYPGKILPLRLAQYGGELLCQRDTFLAGAPGVAIDIAFQKKIMTGLFGGEGFIMQRLSGDGIVFVHAGGTVVERELAPGEELHVDSGCLVAQTASISFDVVPVGGVKSMLFGGEGVFFARLVGPGHVWLQSMPFSRLVGHIAARLPASGGVGVSWPIGGGGGGSGSGSGGDSGGDDA